MKFFPHMGIGIGVGLLTALSLSVGLFTGIERSLEDRLFSPRPVRDDIVIVAIDNESLVRIGQWPWARGTFADVLTMITTAGPRAIGLDVIFAEDSRLGVRDDALLEKVVASTPTRLVVPVEADPLILTNSVARTEHLVRTRTRLDGHEVVRGHVNIIRDRDGVVRRVPLGIHSPDDIVIPAFAAAVVEQELSSSTRPITEQALERIVFAGGPGTIARVPFYQVLNGNPDALALLKNAYVFIGATAADLHDEQITPVSDGRTMSGVEIQAQIANMLLLGYALETVPWFWSVLWIMLIALATFLFFYVFTRIVFAFGASAVLGLVSLVLTLVLFDAGWVANIVHIALAVMLSIAAAFAVRFFLLEREKRDIRHTFSKYVSHDVLELLLNDPSKVQLGGEDAEVTVLFSDVRSFTALSEGLTPTQLTHFLNRYLTRMTDIILEHRGVVDKYIGDAIMAFWGAPLKNERHALLSVLTSLDMLQALNTFNAEGTAQNEPPINIGIGLNTGVVTVGNMGSHQRFDYTILGDTVNLGARLEGQTKCYGVRLLISEFTAAKLTQDDRTEHHLLIRELDKVTVKGKTRPVAIFEVVERDMIEEVTAILDDFTALREHYYAGRWHEAHNAAERVLAHRDDGPTKVLLERIEHFLHEPPAEWSGVYELKSK